MDSLVVCACGHSIATHAVAARGAGCLEKRCACPLDTRAVLDAACAQVRTEWNEQWRVAPTSSN